MTRTASDWFTVMQAEAVSARERSQFSEWLAESPGHVKDYLAVAGVWRGVANTRAAELSAEDLLAQARAESDARNVIQMPGVRSLDTSPAPRAMEDAGPQDARPDHSAGTATGGARSRSLHWVTGVAASIAVFAIGAWLAVDQFQGTRYSTDIGEQVSFTLEDGSTVRLNTQSAIRVRMRPHERLIALVEGEAMFEVAKDAPRPFRVHAGGALVEAIGTVFNVNRTGANTTVTVLEGRVRVSTQRTDDAETSASGRTESADDGDDAVRVTEIAARDSARVIGDGTIVTEHGVSVDRVLAWTDRRLVFHAETLQAVAEEFNRYNRLRVEITDPQLAALRISGNFNATDLRSLIDYLEDVEGVSVEERGDVVRLAR